MSAMNCQILGYEEKNFLLLQSPATALGIKIMPDAHDIGEFTFERACASEGGIVCPHPRIGSLRLTEDDPKSLLDGHEI
jgi:hypothetical protein